MGDSDKAERRREINEKYRQIGQDLQEKLENDEIPDSDYISNKLEKMNILYDKVEEPPEAVKDSGCLKSLALLSKRKVDSVQANSFKFNPLEFARKVSEILHGEQNPTVDITVWAEYGERWSRMSLTTPTFIALYDTFEVTEFVPKPKPEKRPRVEKDNQKPAKEVRPQKITRVDKSDQEMTEEEVNNAFKCLEHHFRKNGKEPLHYFEFVLDPTSFGRSVENIFHVSFLFKDKFAKMTEDENGIPLIEPTQVYDDDEGQAQQQSGTANQFSISMNTEIWKELIDAYKIKKAMITTAKH